MIISATPRPQGGAGPGALPWLGATLVLFLLSCGPQEQVPTAPTREGVRSGLALHKVQLSAEQALHLERAGKAPRTLADYGAFRLVEVEDAALGTLPEGEGVEIRDDSNDLLLNAGVIDTASTHGHSLRGMKTGVAGKRMHLVQFVGPIQPEWYAGLTAAGVRVVAYIPHNAYLVYGDAAALERLRMHVSSTPAIQWNGEYLNDYKLAPSLASARTDTYSLQLIQDDEANRETLELVRRHQKREAVIQEALGYVNVVVSLEHERLFELATRPDVVSIQPHFTPRKADERQALIAAGQLSGTGPATTSYLTWLGSKGFTQAQFTASGFGVDISDDGLENGTLTPNHFGLYTGGDVTSPSRLSYVRLEGTPNSGSSIQGCTGHGAMVAHVLGGHATRNTSQFKDASGFYHGLGVAPFVRMGSSVIFDPDYFTNPDYEDLQSRAYRDGMRISNNSWESASNSYTSEAQRYDALVRDAQPTGAAVSTTGNQEMVIVFSAGNEGSTANSLASPGTAKNVITVGASESVRPFGGPDLCGVFDTLADSAMDLAGFSGRGPTADGRRKPDLVAPGTHIVGGAPQTDAQRSNTPPNASGQALGCFTGDDLCGGPSTVFFPTGQQWFVASTGSSFAAPVVSGGAALVRQHFINQGSTPPSPAMTKAYLMNSARYLTGTGAADNLFSNSQGMGAVDLGRAFDGTARILDDQKAASMFTATGQSRIFAGTIADSGKPVRITLAWTDAPGSTTGAAWNNNLDLTVVHNGTTYRGNVFAGANSTLGGSADAANNVESVFLPAGISGPLTVTVTASNISSDGVPGNSSPLDQDFALVVYNATPATCTAGVTPTGLTASAVGNNRIDLAWSANGATTYTVYRSTTAGGPYTQVASVAAPSYSDTGLPGSVRHYYTVSATVCSESPRSAEVSAVTNGTCSLPPSFAGLESASNAGTTACTNSLSWSPATARCGGTVSYSVYRSTTPGFIPSAANRIATGVNATSFSDDANVANDTAYHYVVRAAEAAAGTIEETNTVQRTVLPMANYFDDFDGNRPPNASAYWIPTATSGSTDTLNIVSNCHYQSATNAYRFGANNLSCGGEYPDNMQAILSLGGNGTVSSGINGFRLSPGSGNQMTFNIWYSVESGYDEASLVYSVNGATGPWSPVGDAATSSAPYISSGGYDRTLGEIRVWSNSGSGTNTGANGSLKAVTVNLDALQNSTIWLGFRFTTDDISGYEGFYVDNVRVKGGGTVCTPRSVPAGSAVTYRLSGLSSPVLANTSIPVTLTALNASGNTATSYTGTANLTSTDSQAVLPATATFSAGVANVSVSFKTSGTQSITAVDTTRSAVQGSASTNVTYPPATQLAFTVQPGTTAAGKPITPAVKVTLLDAAGNPATQATQAVTLSVASNPSGGLLSGTLTVNPVAGVATFSDLSLDKVGSGYTLAASATGLTSATSSTFQITADAASKLAFLTPPSDGVAGATFTPGVRVALLDKFDNPTSATSTVTASLGSNPSGGALSGTLSVNAVSGVATFSNLKIEKAGAGYTLAVSSGALTPVTSGTFTIAAAAPSRIVFTQQPTPTVVGSTLTPAVKAALQDTYGNPATEATNAISIAFANNPAGAMLEGSTTERAVAGVATFSTLAVDRVGSNYTLSATSPGLTSATSTGFNIGATTATQLVFTQQPPTNPTVGAAFSVKVEVRNSAGAPVTGSPFQVALSLVNAAGATLSGPTTASTTAGVATFTGLAVDRVGTGYALQATVTGLPSRTSSAFSVDPGTVTALAFLSQPDTTPAGTAISPAVRVAFQDALGNTVTSSGGSITLALRNNPSGAILAGTLTVAAVNGVATFSTLSLDKPGTDYTLRATFGALAATSAGFNVTDGAATRLVFRSAPANGVAGEQLTALEVELQDALGNRATGSTGPVTLSLGGPSGGTLSGTLTVAAVSGVATFSTLSIDKAATGYTLTASAPGLTSATSAPFSITPGAASALAFTVQPASSGVDTVLAPAVKVGFVDAWGNSVTSTSSTVTLALGNNPSGGALGGGASVAAVNGVATFSNLSLNKPGTGYTLVASASGVSSVTSTAFDIVSLAGATQMVFKPGPVNTPAGNLGTVAVEFQDAEGRRVADTRTVTLTLQGGSGGMLGGTTTVTAGAGLATFNSLSITRAAVGYRLLARAGGLPDLLSAPFDITPGEVTGLAFVTGPARTVAGAAISPALQVALLDAHGNRVTSASRAITLSLGANPAGGTLSGAATQSTVSGVATFMDLSINRVATGYTLIARASGITDATSAAFEITPGAASALVFRVPPGEHVAGSVFFPAVQVAITDALGNTVSSATSPITLALGNNPGGGSLKGSATAAAVDGVANFGSLGIDRVGTGYTLVATAAPSLSVTSPAFNVLTSEGVARLVFKSSPTRATAGLAMSGIQVELRDASGTLINDSSRTVTVGLGENPRGDTLLGTTSVTLVNGVATFDTLSLRKAGSGYTLVASAPGTVAATSAAFAVVGGPATRLALELAPSVKAGQETSLSATAFDAYGNVATSYAGQVKLSSSDSKATLPATATFADGLLGGIQVTFRSGGQTTLTLTDTANASITGSADIRVDTFAPPTVALTEPTGGTVSGAMTITARGSVAAGTTVARLAILVDGVEIAQGSDTTLSTVWDSTQLPAGEHTLTAVITDGSGNTATSAPVSVTTQARGCGCGATSGSDAGLLLGLLVLARAVSGRRRGSTMA
ncbi:S8 family serine peptidase [Archangium violaceum]|uniref:S8 family serine peptidase n=1 Tax=Archangium violaceum TaxID=83451 RepID=UPI0036D9A24D